MGKRSNRGSGRGVTFIGQALASETDDCIIWPFYKMPNGYGQIGTHAGMALAHRYCCEMAHGKPPFFGAQAAHSCGCRSCVNPRHLSWKTQAENEADKHIHGTWFSRMGGARLSVQQVKGLRRDYANGLTPKELSEATGIPKSTVTKVVRRETWKHV